MYPNFRAECARKKLTLEKIVEELRKRGYKTSVSHLSQKLAGKYPITLAEAKDLKAIVETELSIEELFQVEEGE